MKNPSKHIIIGLTVFLLSQYSICWGDIEQKTTQISDLFEVKTIDFIGNSLINSDKLFSSVKKYINTPINFNNLNDIIFILKSEYQKEGYMVDVSIEPQDDIEKKLTVTIREFEIDNAKLSKKELTLFPTLKNKQINNIILSRNIKQLEEKDFGLNYIQPNVTVELSNKPTTLIPKTNIDTLKQEVAKITIDNTGDSANGRARTTFSYINNFDIFGNEPAFQYQTSNTHPHDVALFNLNYSIPFYELGNNFDFYYSHSKSNQGIVNSFFNVAGSGDSIGATFKHRYLPSNDNIEANSYINFNIRWVENDISFFGTQLLKNTQSNVLTIGSEIKKQFINGDYAQINLGYSFNIPFGENGKDYNYKFNRIESDNNYQLLKAQGFYKKRMQNYSLDFLLNSQWSNDALPSHESFGIGGVNSVRGFNEKVLSDDRGFNLNISLNTPTIESEYLKLMPFLFFDSGYVYRNKVLDDEISHTHISSYGMGFNTIIAKRASLRANYGFLLDKPQGLENNDRFMHLSITYEF